MLIYRDRTSTAHSETLLANFLSRLRRFASHFPAHEEVIELLITFGDFETAVVDRLCGERDTTNELISSLREISVTLGCLLYNSWREYAHESGKYLRILVEKTEAVRQSPIPDDVEIRIPEGYAYYGLAPEMYMESAARFSKEARPARAVCIGIRSIGASLSGVVAGTLNELGCRTTSVTLRPRGHPSHRTILVSRDVERLIYEARGNAFLIVDEGPGLSGSSFGCIAELLCKTGVADEKIFLFPSWIPKQDSLTSEEGRVHWGRHKKYCTRFKEVYLDSGKLFSAAEYKEISAGEWRSLFYGDSSRYPPAHPQHERRKFLVQREKTSGLLLYKFAGYGDHGRRKLRRAVQLAESGFGPAALGLAHGFLITEFLPGKPLSPGPVDGPFLQRVASYLAFVAKRFRTGTPVKPEIGFEVIRANSEEILGEPRLTQLNKLAAVRDSLRFSEAVELDGRLFPHEWIRSGGLPIKTDAVDHHNDHFYPGPEDPAWDIAAFSIEFGLTPAQEEYLAESLHSLARVDLSPAKVLYYKIFYLAFRAGYASTAAGTLANTQDGRRFELLFRRYSRLLEHQFSILG